MRGPRASRRPACRTAPVMFRPSRAAAIRCATAARCVPGSTASPPSSASARRSRRRARSVWVTVAFLERDVAMPGGRGTFFDVLDRAAARGARRARRSSGASPSWKRTSRAPLRRAREAERAWLRAPRRALRRALGPPAGPLPPPEELAGRRGRRRGEVAFVGGINLDASSVSCRGPRAARLRRASTTSTSRCAGPAATDVHHNFVQRWNEASERAAPRRPLAGGPRRGRRCPFRRVLSPPAGDVPVQITRTVRARPLPRRDAGRPGRGAFAIDERRVQRPRAVPRRHRRRAPHDLRREPGDRRARASSARLDAGRSSAGVEVVFLVPGNCRSGRTPRPSATRTLKPFFDLVASLGRFANFTLAAIASPSGARAATTRSTCTPRSCWSTTPGRRSARRTSRSAPSAATPS